jgi:hypothetical protein
MSTALILNRNADDATVDEFIAKAAARCLVACMPKQMAAGQPFRIVFIAPDANPATWRRLFIAERLSTERSERCAA